MSAVKAFMRYAAVTEGRMAEGAVLTLHHLLINCTMARPLRLEYFSVFTGQRFRDRIFAVA